jgi:hypothetical protein
MPPALSFVLDRYIADVLMRDLVGHDRQPAAFLVYLWLYARTARAPQRRVAISLRDLADATGLSKSSVQTAVVHHNMDPVLPGAGSAIFLHIWRTSASPTVGCTAMSRARLISLIRWLSPEKRPVLVQVPMDASDQIKFPVNASSLTRLSR